MRRLRPSPRPRTSLGTLVTGALVLGALIASGAGTPAPPSALAQPPAPRHAPALTGVRLYVLDCGTLIFNYPEEYSLTREEVKNTNMSVACYLVVHPKGTLLFDAGLPDSVRGRPFNQAPFSGVATAPSTDYYMLVTNTLKGQLAQAGYTAAGIDYLVLSHFHGDHVGNANDYSSATWLVQQAEYDAMFGPQVPPGSIDPNYRRLKASRKQLLRGDHDVFGDGSVVVKSTRGHTPGHQSLFVQLAKTGNVVLSGDLYHYPEERTLRRMPSDERTRGTAASREALERFLRKANAQLWVGHDITAFSRQRKAPAFYE